MVVVRARLGDFCVGGGSLSDLVAPSTVSNSKRRHHQVFELLKLVHCIPIITETLFLVSEGVFVHLLLLMLAVFSLDT